MSSFLKSIEANYALADKPNYKYEQEESKQKDAELVTKLQKMLHKEHLKGCDDTSSCDISFAAENDYWHWAIELFYGSGAASSKFEQLYKQLSPDFKKEAEKERKLMVKEPHKQCKHCHSVNWGDDLYKCGQCLNPISASVSEYYKGYDIDLCDQDKYENFIIYDKEKGEYLEDQPVAYTIEDAKKLVDWYIRHKSFSNYIVTSACRPLSAEDAVSDLLTRYYDKRVKSIADKVLSNKKEKAVAEEEEEHLDHPSEDDAFLAPSGYLGSKTSVSVDNKHLGEFKSDREAEHALVEWINKHKFFPNIWYVTDHGNVSPYTLDPEVSKMVKI